MTEYIDKKKMYEAFVRHKERVSKAREAGAPDPPLSNYIGECFMKIAEKTASRDNFSGYSFRDEMISDGVENCIIAANNFDPERMEKNPFGYFTKIVWWAFLRRIEKEAKQTYVKFKSMQNMAIAGEIPLGEAQPVDNGVMDQIVSNFEKKRRTKDQKIRTSKRKRGVELLFPDDEMSSVDLEIDLEVLEGEDELLG